VTQTDESQEAAGKTNVQSLKNRREK